MVRITIMIRDHYFIRNVKSGDKVIKFGSMWVAYGYSVSQ